MRQNPRKCGISRSRSILLLKEEGTVEGRSLKSVKLSASEGLTFDGLSRKKKPWMNTRERKPPVFKSLIACGSGCDPEAGTQPG